VPFSAQVFHADQIREQPAVAIGAAPVGRAFLIDALGVDVQSFP